MLLIILEALSQFHAAVLIIAHKHNYRDFCPRDLSKTTAGKANGLFNSPNVSVKIF